MKLNWISRLDFLKLGIVSLVALPLSSLRARANKANQPVKYKSAPGSQTKVRAKYPPGSTHREYMGWHKVEESGAEMAQITSSPLIHEHIYPEAPIFTPDSRFFVYARRVSPDQPVSFWLCEVGTWRLFRITDESPVSGPVTSPDGEYLYYEWEQDNKIILIRKHLWSGKREEWIEASGIGKTYWLGTISPEGRYYCSVFRDDKNITNIIRFDLVERTWKIIHSRTDIFNAHPQCEPGKGKDILIQHNRGGKVNQFGEFSPLVGPEGATLYLIDINGKNVRPLSIGKPLTPRIQGHQCWLGKTGKVIATLSSDIEIDGKKGNLVIIADGDKKPRVVAGGTYLWHVASSPDGKYFICDDPQGNIYIGSVRTGKYRKLCCSGSILGARQYTHSHPFLSPDCRFAFFNSTASVIPHIYCASIPEKFLESLET